MTDFKRRIEFDVGKTRLRTPMPNTGLFDIIDALATRADESPACLLVCEVHAQCLTCQESVQAKAGSGLESVEGGVVIACPECGARQGVSNCFWTSSKVPKLLQGAVPVSR